MAVRDALLLAMTVATGAVDVVSYVRLGRVFTANMTGNLVLLGISGGAGRGRDALLSAMALLGFAVGALLGALFLHPGRARGPLWPPRVTIALAAEVVLLSGFEVGWQLTHARPEGAALFVLIIASALAMGVQSAATRRLTGSAISTTYLTGMLTVLMEALAASPRRPAELLRPAAALLALVTGALLGAVLLSQAPLLTPLLSATTLGAVTIVAALYFRQKGHGHHCG